MYESSPVVRNDGAPVIGLALGSGAARGWAHIGVLRALAADGIRPDVVCGCSIGALVGAALASGRIDPLADWVGSLDWQDVVGMLDIRFKGGLIRGDRVLQYCAQHFFLPEFSDLQTPFSCVATDLSSGREIWLKDGSLADAVRASMALPGLFSPVSRAGRILVDGSLVNPVPVSLCRALGADIVIAVELGSGVVGRSVSKAGQQASIAEGGFARRLLHSVGLMQDGAQADPDAMILPSLTDVVASSINIMQMRIARSRLAGEPADVLISPRVAHINMMEFDRAEEAMHQGEAAVHRSRPMLQQALSQE